MEAWIPFILLTLVFFVIMALFIINAIDKNIFSLKREIDQLRDEIRDLKKNS